jgi:hypothetical protein
MNCQERVIGCAFTVFNTLGAGFLDLPINDVDRMQLCLLRDFAKPRLEIKRVAHRR